MARLAIVITAGGSIESLESTLVSVLENRPHDCEVLVALAGPYADPYELSGEVRFVAAERNASTLAATARALASTAAPFVHLLSSGCKVSEGWADRALQRFGDKRVAAVTPWVACADHEDRVFAAGIGYRPSGARYRVSGSATSVMQEAESCMIGPGSFAAFYRKSALDAVGGLACDLTPTTADAETALALAAAGFTNIFEPQSRVTASSGVDLERAGFRKALAAERLFWRHRPTGGRSRSLPLHALAVAWEFICALPRVAAFTQLAGRALGLVLPSTKHTAAQKSPGPAAAPRPTGQWRVDRPHPGVNRGETSQAAPTR